ncbi:hypothetical protein [Burkholderia ambifaria]|uniref:hypothetical protein n=1 Tax=Burkholderia ambifaria TaxID=152480 RepID=UPI000F810AEB|nr:hypothetical protein [Burkholderia ambifaria]
MDMPEMNMHPLDDESLDKLRRMLGRASVNGGTARKMGIKGIVPAAQSYFAELDLTTFNVDTKTEFEAQLDKHTSELRAVMQRVDARDRFWGPARKFLNIFLRNCAYNRFLCAKFGLERIETWMELPLDKFAFVGLQRMEQRKAPGEISRLPTWPGVVRLTLEKSKRYQDYAQEVADDMGIARVHLDIHFWNAERDETD